MKQWLRAMEYGAFAPDAKVITQLEQFHIWLLEEAIPSGGLAPGEAGRIATRHIGDSILFAGPVRDAAHVTDIGSGVGLPGIPLAVMMPGTQFSLVERSGRRARLLRRVVRILDLPNVEVMQCEVGDLSHEFQHVVSRASLPPDRLSAVLGPHLRPGAVVVCGGSWVARPEYVGWETVAVPESVLDQPVWLLIMRQQ